MHGRPTNHSLSSFLIITNNTNSIHPFHPFHAIYVDLKESEYMYGCMVPWVFCNCIVHLQLQKKPPQRFIFEIQVGVSKGLESYHINMYDHQNQILILIFKWNVPPILLHSATAPVSDIHEVRRHSECTDSRSCCSFSQWAAAGMEVASRHSPHLTTQHISYYRYYRHCVFSVLSNNPQLA